MSYRTKINGTQIFGNNECYQEWLNFIKSQGIEVGEEGNYEGEITDFMKALEVIEQITMNKHKERQERIKSSNLFEKHFEKDKECIHNDQKLEGLFDFRSIPRNIEETDPDDKFRCSLFDEELEVIRYSYALLPYQFYLACKDKLEQERPFFTPGHLNCYKLKEGETLHVCAN